MKKYSILGHIFELDDRAHDFLASYITRIETYAQHNQITSDILEDIKYNIIEKLYTTTAPISESFVMNVAQTIGEPEAIFENKSETDETPPTNKNLLERRLGKQKPMIWGVCYWIAKSLNIPVSIVRLIFLVAVCVYGTGIWLYPLLALFVPFKDKTSTTGQTGNLFFELIRIIIWLGVILFLGAAIFGSIIGLTAFSVLPSLSNQTLQTLVPSYLYPLAIISIIVLIILLIGSIGALIKKSRVSKTVALISIVIIIGSVVATGLTGFTTISKYNYNPKTTDIATIETLKTDEATIILNLHGDNSPAVGNYFDGFLFGLDQSLDNEAIFQEIKLLSSDNDELRIEVVDSINVLAQNEANNILSKRSKIIASSSGNIIDITLPDNIFSQKVPFAFAHRTINIYIPKDKKLIYNNESKLRYSTPGTWYEYGDADYPQKVMYCTDKNSFIYYENQQDWRCANTTYSAVNQNRTNYNDNGEDRKDLEDHIEDYFDNLIDLGNLTPDQEDLLEATYQGLSLTQAQSLADSKGHMLRVVKQDGIELARTEDYRPGRLNVEVNNNTIIEVDIE